MFQDFSFFTLNVLEPMLEAMGSRIEIIEDLSEPDGNHTNIPALQTLWEDRADLGMDWFAYKHDRLQIVDYLHAFRVS